MSGSRRAAVALACGACLLGCRHEFPGGDGRPAVDQRGDVVGFEGVPPLEGGPPKTDGLRPQTSSCTDTSGSAAVSFSASVPPTAGKSLSLTVKVTPGVAYADVMVQAHEGPAPGACLGGWVGGAEGITCNPPSTCTWQFPAVPVSGTPPFSFTFIAHASPCGTAITVGTCTP